MKRALEREGRADLIAWYDAMEVLCSRFGDYDMPAVKDPTEGLGLALKSKHKDAVWFCSLFPPWKTWTPEEMGQVLAAVQPEDRRAQFFASFLPYPPEPGLPRPALERAAALGYPPALSCSPSDFRSAVKRQDAAAEKEDRKALRDDRRALRLLGESLTFGHGCVKDEAKAQKCFQRAAELGEPYSQFRVGQLLGVDDVQRYQWWALAAARGFSHASTCLAQAAKEQLKQRARGVRIVVMIGSVCQGQLNASDCRAFRQPCVRQYLETLQKATKAYEQWAGDVRQAVECWLMIARRNGVPKDLRLVVARGLWVQRWDWNSVGEKGEQKCMIQ